MRRRTLLQAGAALAPSGRLSAADAELIAELAETIIPADAHSGGAKAAKVGEYIEGVLRASSAADRKLWTDGLRKVGPGFLKASPEERYRIVAGLSKTRFFQELKRLTVVGYYTSKVGIAEELEYQGNRVMKEFSGCGG